MNERKQGTLIGWGAIALFAIGTLGTVLMYLAMKTTVPLEQKGVPGQLALAWKNVFGIFPSLFLNAALLFLGARLFIKGGTAMLWRNIAGCVALAVALSILFGALSSGAGGAIGARTGEVLTTRTHIAVGALVGLVSIFAAVWFAWLRSTMVRPAFAPSKSAAEPAAKPAPKPLARPVATRLSTPQSAATEEGVTAAESEALFPFEEPEPKPIAAVPLAVARPEPIEAATAMPRSPYPEDLRLKGQIPPGAKPLEAPTPPQTAAPAAYRWTAPRTNADETTDDGSATREPMLEAESAVRGPRPLRRVDDDEPSIEDMDDDESPAVAAYADVHGGDDVGLEGEIDEAEGVATPLRAEALDVEAESAAVGRPAPSWEQPALFRPEAGDEEPVDAYGTPLTLVEKLRQARRLAGLEREDARVVDELAGDADENALAAEQAAAGLTPAELGTLMGSSVAEDVLAEEVVAEEVVAEEDGAEEVELADEEDEEGELEEAGEDEITPMRSRAIPREIDAEYDADAELDDDEAAEDLDAEDLEDETVVVGSESIDDEDIVIVGADDEEPVTAATARDDVDFDGPDIDTDDEEEAEDEILVTEAIAEDAEVAMPMARASAEPVLEPLTLPAIAPIGRSEPIQPGLFDAPDTVARPLQPAVAQSKPAKSEPASSKPEAAAKQPDAVVKQPEAVAKRPDVGPSKPEAAARKSEPASKKIDVVTKSAEPATSKPEVAASKSAASQPKPAASPKSRSASAENEVTLQPVAASSAKPAASVKSPAADTKNPNLLSEIGCLFIERGRVAVSMLQRQYAMDFDEACKVLDDLQEMGLIGPYLGGQRRDILLTRDQWLERVSQAGAAR